MANEMQTSGVTGLTLYAVILNSTAQIWNTVSLAFETPNSTHWTDYDVAMTEADASGIYSGNFPTSISTPGTYTFSIREKTGGSPAVSDVEYATSTLVWDGSGVSTVGPYVIDASTAKTMLGITGTSKDAFLALAIPMVDDAIKRWLNSAIYTASYSQVVDGKVWNSIRVFNLPVNTITSVILNVDQSTPTTIDGSNFKVSAKTGLIKFKDSSVYSQYFPEGFQNIQVNYTAGYSSVPPAMQHAAVLLLNNLMMHTDKNILVASKTVGDVSTSWQKFLDLNEPMNAQARELLRPFKPVRLY